jgi:hypothetical protein
VSSAGCACARVGGSSITPGRRTSGAMHALGGNGWLVDGSFLQCIEDNVTRLAAKAQVAEWALGDAGRQLKEIDQCRRGKNMVAAQSAKFLDARRSGALPYQRPRERRAAAGAFPFAFASDRAIMVHSPADPEGGATMDGRMR